MIDIYIKVFFFIIFLDGSGDPIRRFHNQRSARLLDADVVQVAQVELLRAVQAARAESNRSHTIV